MNNIEFGQINKTFREFVSTGWESSPLEHHYRLSKLYQAEVLLKREDKLSGASYKIRGFRNELHSLLRQEQVRHVGLVCAFEPVSAMTFAHALKGTGISCIFILPKTTEKNIQSRILASGGELHLVNLLEHCYEQALQIAVEQNRQIFGHPTLNTLLGDASLGIELADSMSDGCLNYVFLPVGNTSFVGNCAKGLSHLNQSNIKVIGVEPNSSRFMHQTLSHINTPAYIKSFVYGEIRSKIDDLGIQNCYEMLDAEILEICSVEDSGIKQMLGLLFEEDNIITSLESVMVIAALNQYKEEIKGQKVVCVLGNGYINVDTLLE